ncbi:MAG: hypothetical protein ACKVW3_16205 [Phycisphaerales bacterium]
MIRRAFVLPIVIFLALLVGIVAAMLLERQSAHALSVERQARSYRDRHFEKGLREVLSAWTESLTGQPIDQLIGDDGHALDLATADGGWVEVYMFDGQSTALNDPTGLTEQEFEDAAGLLDALVAIVGDQPDPSWFRTVGPVKICVNSAPEQLLEAAASYATGGKAGRRFVRELMDAKAGKGVIEAPDLETAKNADRIGPEERAILDRLITLKPDLWAMVVDVYPPGGGSFPVARYGGRFMAPGTGGRSTSMQALGKFLSWEPLPIQ